MMSTRNLNGNRRSKSMLKNNEHSMITLCILRQPISRRAAYKKPIIELYTSYGAISKAFDQNEYPSISAYSSEVIANKPLQQLSESIKLNKNIYVYGRLMDGYLVLIYFQSPSYIKSLKRFSDLDLLDECISVFIKLKIVKHTPLRVLTNLQNLIDLLSTLNPSYSSSPSTLVYYDDKCRNYTQIISRNTADKGVIKRHSFLNEADDDMDDAYFQKYRRNSTNRRVGQFFATKSPPKNQYLSANERGGRSRSFRIPNVQIGKVASVKPKWQRKSISSSPAPESVEVKQRIATTNTTKKTKTQKWRKKEKNVSAKPEKTLNAKYESKFNEIKQNLIDLLPMIDELGLDKKENESKPLKKIEKPSTDELISPIQINQSMASPVQIVEQKSIIDDFDDIVYENDDFKQKEVVKRRSSSSLHNHRGTVLVNNNSAHHQQTMSDQLIGFQLKWKMAKEIKQKLISDLKALINQIENDAVLFDDDDDDSDLSDLEHESDDDFYENKSNDDLIFQQLKMSAITWLKTASNNMTQNGICEGIKLLKSLFDAFAKDNILNNDHKALCDEIYEKLLKYFPINQKNSIPLLSPTSSTTSTIDLTPKMSAHQSHPLGSRFLGVQTPFNSPAISRSASASSTVQQSLQEQLPSTILEEDVLPLSNPSLLKKFHQSSRSRSRSNTVDDALSPCDATIKQQYKKMMGTISDESAFKAQIQSLLVEVANANIFSSDEDIESDDDDHKKADSPPKKRSSVRIKDIQSDFVDNIVKIEKQIELTAGEWDFDPIAFAKNAQLKGNALVVFVWHLIKINDWHSLFKMDYKKIICFLYQIQCGYEDNLYHNVYHAVDVVNNVYWFLNNCSMIKQHFDEFDKFLTIMAAAVHDVGHNGKNNAFHKRTKSELALRYYNVSILENFHIYYAFKVMTMDKKCDWLSDLKEGEIEKTRKYFIRMILGTDMENHKKHEKFINNMLTKKDEKEMSEDDKIGVLTVLLHAADIGNAAKPRTICVEWAKRCVGEFREQGDKETELFGECSQLLFDRKHPLEKSQCGWIQYVMMAYFKAINKMFDDDAKSLLAYLEQNHTQWSKYTEDMTG